MSEDEKHRLKAREEFLRLMSHEMRTPLNGVIGMLGLLARTRMDGAQKAYVQSARASAEHMLGLVNDLLDFARIEAGKVELETAPVDVEMLVQGVAELLSPRAHEKGIEIAWAVDASVPEIVADEGRLRQILFNLAGNAVKFTDAGGVLIRAAAANRGSRSRVRFTVSDTGPGVPLDARERIFEEFGHADPHHATRYGGAGLGLAVVKRLVEAMDGKVGVESVPGEGATFWFEAQFSTTGATARAQPLEDVSVAVASPSPQVLEAAAAQIAAAGGQVWAAPSVEAALSAASEDAPVLVDHAFAADGKSLVLKPRGRKALVLLKPEERHLIEKYRGAGYLGYLIKPLRRCSLAERTLAIAPGAPAQTGPRTEDERVANAGVAGVRVLLAEDNPVNALLVQTLLKREGCTVELAGTGEEALAALAHSRYDLVLMDMRMPGMDGPATARALRAREDATPIIALTANSFESDRRECLEAGMNAFLTKPLEPAALRAALIRWTNRDSRVKLAS
ncbi:MAG: response regulator [Caulobacteraceae bacterium]|nr:response regulator [Caulobacteraceae bacterium]